MKKTLVAYLLKLIQMTQKAVMIQTMKLTKYKHLNSKFKENKIKELEDNIKKIKTSINKSKCISCQKCFTKLKRMKNTQSQIKPIKFGKELRTTHCWRCKDFTHNFRPQDVEKTNQVL